MSVHIIELSSYTTPSIQEAKRDEWVEFGDDNNFFQFLIDRYNGSTTNSAIINNVARLIYGRGLSALNAAQKPSEYAQMMALFSAEDLRKICHDRKHLGQFAFQVHYSDNRDKILKAYHMPVQLLRAQKCNEEGEITHYFYSDDWTDTKKFVPTKIPAFGTSNEAIEIMYVKPYAVGMKYYALPDYQGALAYALLEEEVANYLINDVKNHFAGRTVVNFNNGIPSPEKQLEMASKVKRQLTGSKGDPVIVSFNDNETQKTTVDNIPLNDAPKHYEYLAEEAMRKIMLGHNVTSPLLFGIATTTGFSSNADELKNSTILFDNMVIRPIQDEIIEALNQILSFNGISLKLFFEGLQPLNEQGDLIIGDESNSIITAINSLSPLVANKVLESMTDQEIRNLVGLQSQFERVQTELSAIDVESFGHEPDANWVLIDESEVDYDSEDDFDSEINSLNTPKKTALQKIVELVKTGTARPRAQSEDDKTIDGLKFITRYRYSEGISDDTREFCRKMVNAKKVYRKEDIIQMGSQAVNAGWGPKGADTYSIWLYKGGGSCHHKWIRQTYVAASKGSGIDPTSPNARTISTNKAEKAGYRVRNPKEVAMKPIDMPNKGFLPK
jgi:hypothetical protein